MRRKHQPLKGASPRKTAHSSRKFLVFLLSLSPVAGAFADKVLEEVVVTATKREQAINDIPVAVSAYGGETLRQSGIRDVGQVVQVNPSLNFGTTETSAGGNMSIRGVGTLGTDPGLESSVGVFIDGVYRNRSGVAIDELGEIERVEVLRGPQGSLFGRNTSAGLVHVITKAPDFEETGGFAEVTLGNRNLRRGAFAATGPLSDDLAGRVDAVITKQDGYFKDINSNDTLNNRDRFMVRSQLAWDASDDVSARFILDYSKREELCCGAPFSQTAFGPQNPDWSAPGIPALALANASDRATDGNDDPYDGNVAVTSGQERTDDTEQWGISAEVNWDLEDSQLVSITSYRDWNADIGGDLDFNGANLLYYPSNDPQQRNFETFTQELRWQGAWDKGSWLVGMFYSDETLSGAFNATHGDDLNAYAERIIDTLAAAPGTYDALTTIPGGGGAMAEFIGGEGVRDESEQEGQSIAVFSQNDFDLTEDLVLTVGVRYTHEEKEMELTTTNTFGITGNPCAVAQGNVAGAPPGHPSRSLANAICGIGALAHPLLAPGTYRAKHVDEEVTGTVKLAYTLPDETLVFFNVARGFKAGGFNQVRLGINPLDPSGDDLEFERELADTVEVGVKTYLFDQTMALNATLFYSEFQDYQLGQFTGVTLETVSVDQVDSQGVELEANWQASDQLLLSGGVTYMDNHYPEDSNIDEVAPAAVTRAGQRRSRALTATASALYSWPVNDKLTGRFYIDARYMGEESSNSSLAPIFDQDDYTIFNARFSLTDLAETWSIELWARNLTDEEYTPIQFDPPPLQGQSGVALIPGAPGTIADFIGEPRSFGVTGRRNF